MNFDFSKACDMVYHRILLDKLVKDEVAKWTRLVIPSGQKGRDSDTKSNWLSVPNDVSQVLMCVTTVCLCQ